MMPPKYLTPKEAAAALGLSTATISRCVKRGAPVHRWGSTGTRYRICLEEFVAWMERQNSDYTFAGETQAQQQDAEEMARKRREMIRAL